MRPLTFHGLDWTLQWYGLLIRVRQFVLVRKARKNNKTLPGHLCVLHLCHSFARPSLQQYRPPFAGGGLVHERERYRIPPSHDLLHLFQAPHFEYPP